MYKMEYNHLKIKLMKATYGSSMSSLFKIHPIMQEEMSFEAIVDDRQWATDTTTAHFE